MGDESKFSSIGFDKKGSESHFELPENKTNIAQLVLYLSLYWNERQEKPLNNNNNNNELVIPNSRVQEAFELAARWCASEWSEGFISMLMNGEYPIELEDLGVRIILGMAPDIFLQSLSKCLKMETPSQKLLQFTQKILQLINDDFGVVKDIQGNAKVIDEMYGLFKPSDPAPTASAPPFEISSNEGKPDLLPAIPEKIENNILLQKSDANTHEYFASVLPSAPPLSAEQPQPENSVQEKMQLQSIPAVEGSFSSEPEQPQLDPLLHSNFDTQTQLLKIQTQEAIQDLEPKQPQQEPLLDLNLKEMQAQLLQMQMIVQALMQPKKEESNLHFEQKLEEQNKSLELLEANQSILQEENNKLKQKVAEQDRRIESLEAQQAKKSD